MFKCTLSDEELADAIVSWAIDLAKTGGKSWSLHIPPEVNRDPDILMTEVADRLRSKCSQLVQALEAVKVEQKAHEEIASLCFAAGFDTPDGTSVGAVRSAIEAVEKLREALKDRMSIYYARDVPHQSDHPHCRCRSCVNARTHEALTATEPATVDLPKCDHCGAIACGTDCDGSSHYTPEKKE